MPQARQPVAIVTDSASSLTPEIAREHDIHIVPIYVIFGKDVYRDGVDLDAEKYYHLLHSSKQLPTTAQPTAADFAEVYTRLGEQAEAIVSIHPSHKISATVDSARAAAQQITAVPVHVIDSESVMISMGLSVLMAARAAQTGQSVEQVVQVAKDVIAKMNMIAMVDTLEYLHKGGRIGGAAALMGSMMKIKPILHIQDGLIEPLEKPRTKKRAMERLLALIEERTGGQPIRGSVVHCNVPDDAQALYERVQTRFDCLELLNVEAGPVIGTHAGPGTVGLAFYVE
ncbi:MAG: DegV family protein [Anaerolineae bacterium]|nr:DegV family protein [Anaerolineae bacterium]